eukprot:CAMPEP_0170113114 /NCGR_PEP_ID=MMETSP0020_2-20130122/9647_1 /TAXON_ID=98059 /ORGANISM="Dinobryon sp., Strain UTEXLB2267" /LENGTH=557 /DNA_ID=CAMNT_0010339311 /DNA_START=54 /DNA_END=1727 /DNA_ORIENTATION=-
MTITPAANNIDKIVQINGSFSLNTTSTPKENSSVAPSKGLLYTENKKASYLSSADVKVIYEGSKSLWRQRLSFDVFIVNHKVFKVIEVICFNPAADTEAPRMYFSPLKLKSKLDTSDIEEKVKSRKEFLIRQKKPIVHDELMEEVVEDQIVHYITSKLNVKEADYNSGKFSVVVQQTGDVANEDIVCEKPADLRPLEISYPKTSSIADFQSKLTQFRKESNAAKKQNEIALSALYAENNVSNILAFKLHQELEFRRKCSKAKLRWIHAINKVMVQNYVAKVRLRLAEIEEAQEKNNVKITRIKQQRKTLDNSLLEGTGHHNTFLPNKLPTLRSSQQQILPMPRLAEEGESSRNKLEVLPRLGGVNGATLQATNSHGEMRGSIQQSNRDRRSRRRIERRSFEPSASPSMVHAMVNTIRTSPSAANINTASNHGNNSSSTTQSTSSHNPFSPSAVAAAAASSAAAASLAASAVAAESAHHIDLLLSSANRPVPSILHSYRERSLQAMTSLKTLSIPSHELAACESLAAVEREKKHKNGSVTTSPKTVSALMSSHGSTKH